MRLMRNFGFQGFDNVVYLGVNGKMSEIHAAMGLTNLEAIEDIIAINQRNYEAYKNGLAGVSGISVIDYDPAEQNNYQYVVIEVDPELCARNRDEIVEAHRRLLGMVHPDRGGTSAQVHEANAARDLLLDQLPDGQ